MSRKVAAVHVPNVDDPTCIGVDLIDFIDLESHNVMALGDMVRAISDVLTTSHDDEGTQDIFPGLAVVGNEIRNKVEAIKGNADRIFKAYVAATGGAR